MLYFSSSLSKHAFPVLYSIARPDVLFMTQIDYNSLMESQWFPLHRYQFLDHFLVFLSLGDWDCHPLDPTVWHVSFIKSMIMKQGIPKKVGMVDGTGGLDWVGQYVV